jgi:hypothetical protein
MQWMPGSGSILYADVRRQRGNQYQAHLQEQTPNVLDFACEVIMSGLDLPRPVNYGLVRILPPADTPSDPRKRPFVVVDPRAGHGPGIGGFKPDSEVGAALKAGHPCYFVGFLPDPVPGQTVEDVMRAEAAFVRKVGELHPDSRGKPCGHRQLPGGLADPDGSRRLARAVRADHRRRRAAVVLGGRHADALRRRPDRR